MTNTNQNSWWLTQVVLKFKSLVEITRKLHKKSPIYFYTIYTTLKGATLRFMQCL